MKKPEPKYYRPESLTPFFVFFLGAALVLLLGPYYWTSPEAKIILAEFEKITVITEYLWLFKYRKAV